MVSQSKTLNFNAPDHYSLYVCPTCKNPPKINQETLNCQTCKISYPIIDGIPDFILEDLT